MQPIKKILVAVKDPRARALPALIKGIQLARAWDAEIELFHAVDTAIYINILDMRLADEVRRTEAQGRQRYQQQLERVAERGRRSGIKVTTCVEWDFPVYESIIRRANRIRADLIIAERHGGRHFAPRLLDLTDWELLRMSPLPVLLVKNPRPYRRPVVLAALDPAHAYSKPARLDAKILGLAAAMENALHGNLHAVHAYVPMWPLVPPEAMLAAHVAPEIETNAATRAKARFERALRSAEIPKARRHLVRQHPADAIESVAREIHCDLVVMGAVSRSALKRVFIGNTAERVLDHLACDLLIVKSARFTSHVPRSARGVRWAAAIPIP